MKTLNFELSKRLNDLGLLDNIETEYMYDSNNDFKLTNNILFLKGIDMKTLTLEEAIEFLPHCIKEGCLLKINKYETCYEIQYMNNGTPFQNGKTLLEAVENMIEYLLDNNLIGN